MSGDCRVVLEGAVRVTDVSSAEEAVNVAIASSGDRLADERDAVVVRAADRTHGNDDCPPAFLVADTALVALEYELTVFDVDDENHAASIARSELGAPLGDTALSVQAVTPLPDTEEEATAADETEGEPLEEPIDEVSA